MIRSDDLRKVLDSTSLAALLSVPEPQGGLGWPIYRENAFYQEPEIAHGISGGIGVEVSSLVPSGEEGERLVVLAEFQKAYVRKDLRDLLTSLRKHIRETDRWKDRSGLSDTLFIVAGPDYQNVEFVLFQDQGRRLPRIRSFGWERKNIGRTVLSHNLERLRWSARDDWDRAWDVEGLTDEFYKSFVDVFDRMMEATEHPGGHAAKHSYVQQLLNRLLFISFIERMGWIKPPSGGGDPHDYLKWLWDRHKSRPNPAAYYQSLVSVLHHAPKTFNGLLNKVFFDGLDDGRRFGVGPDDELYALVGEIPYLNGGLFSQEAGLDVPGVTVEDGVFGLLFDEPAGLFRRFNFTVTESTPLDQQAAVDPEMLGKIFERIIIAEERHRTGTYYTPRPIVEFMVNEALKGYLVGRGLPEPLAELLVDEDKVEGEELFFRPTEMQNTLDWLFEVRAVDPACGSGAYLLMLLQRLFELVDRLEVVRDKKRNENPHHLYATKLSLLERCIYGVDISEVAVRIARLRMWLSLVVENKGVRPEPLPSFDFLIMCGDSLAAPVLPDQHALAYPERAIQAYAKLKHRYFHPGRGEERPTRKQMGEQRADIADAYSDLLASAKLSPNSENAFQWEIEFAEVWCSSDEKVQRAPGFDIVLANPPYIREQLIVLSKSYLRERFPEAYHGKADLYVYFFNLALNLLCAGGELAFITPNRWLKTDYAKPLRKLLSNRLSPVTLIDFDDQPVFQGQTTYSLITLASRRSGQPTTFLKPLAFDGTSTDLREEAQQLGELVVIPADGHTWPAMRQETEAGSTTLGLATGGGPYLGLKTGLNDPFYLSPDDFEQLVDRDPRLREIIRPLVRGKDIRKWSGFEHRCYVLWLNELESLDPYPVIMDHLLPYRDALERRQNRGPKYWQFRSSKLYPLFGAEKVAFPDISSGSRFSLIKAGAVIDTSAFFFPQTDKFLLGVLNSKSAEHIFDGFGVKMRGGFYRFNKSYSERIPIPDASPQDRELLESLVSKLISSSDSMASDGVAEIEAQVDEVVAFLYAQPGSRIGFTNWKSNVEAEKGTAVAELRKLIAGGEAGMVEFKQSLEYVDPNHPDFLKIPESARAGKIAETRKAVTHSALKAIAAFLNSKGGTLLIGVHDNGTIIGIEPDFSLLGQKQDRDGFGLKLNALLKTRFNPLPHEVTSTFIEIEGKTICQIQTPASRTPHFLDGDLYIRLNNQTERLSPAQIKDWLENRP